MRSKLSLASLSAVFMAALPTAALAHPGHEQTSSFLQGVGHPFSGIDHILAMVMIGLFAVQLGGRAIWVLPLTFVSFMALGSLGGAAGIAPSLVEIGIGVSVVVLGGLIAMQVRLPVIAATALAAVIALFHGYAHGAEAQGGVSMLYLAGFLTGTAVLHAGGIGAGLGLARAGGSLGTRIAGGLAAVAGMVLVAG